ncbi:MAG: hypothetical protein ACYC27_09775 [Armatimonadota bacterium]
MNKLQNWPSRQLQVAIIIVLAASVAIRVFMPPLSREGKAGKLYIDSWYYGYGLMGGEITPKEKAKTISMLEKALELSPGNTLYEQALVWQYPLEKRAELLERPKPLGEKARILASGLIYNYLDNKVLSDLQSTAKPAENTARSAADPGTPGYSKLFPPEYWKLKLKLIGNLIAADPDNAFPRYLRALVYSNMEQPSDMLAEVKTANRMNHFNFYKPELSEKLENSTAYSSMHNFRIAEMSNLARRLTDYGDRQLRRGNADSAIDAYEECCLMGVRVSASDKPDYSVFSISNKAFTIGWRCLEPVYKDYGMAGKLDRYQRINHSYKTGIPMIMSATLGEYDPDNDEYSGNNDTGIPFTGPISYMQVAIIVLPLLLFSIIGWGIMALIRRIKKQSALNIPVWSEGWLARLFIAVYIPLTIALWLVADPVHAKWIMEYTYYMFPLSLLLFHKGLSIILTAQIVLMAVTIIVLRRRYIEHTGERISFLWFIFRVPSSVRAWRNRSLAAMLAGQMVFLICCGMVFAHIYKSTYDAYPWQPLRIQYKALITDENEIIGKYAREVQRLYYTDGT